MPLSHTLRIVVVLCVANFFATKVQAGQRVDQIQKRGYLVCGVARHDPGFSEVRPDGQFVGLEVDLCRAVAVAVLGSGANVRFQPLETVHEFLSDATIDLVFHRLTWTLTREAPGQLEFGPVYFFEPQSKKTIAPLAPLLRSGDVDFIRIVRWTVFALIEAEERGTLTESARQTGPSLGLPENWSRHVIAEVGHYGDIYERHFGIASTNHLPRGTNRLWRDGGLLYAPAMHEQLGN